MSKYNFALQLYTVREEMAKDPKYTLKRVKAIGYDHVEVAGTGELSASSFKSLLDRAAVTAISAHIGFEDATDKVPQTIEMAQTLGVKHVVVSGIDRALTPDRAGWERCGQMLDLGGAQLRAAGIQLSYHNHAHEFEAYDGVRALDILLGAAQPENLAAQIDTFWVQYAKLDPAKLIEKYAGRCPLIHVKDMLDRKSCSFAEMGRGCMKWSDILPAAREAGAKWYIVEQDVCSGPPLDCAKVSAEFMAEQ